MSKIENSASAPATISVPAEALDALAKAPLSETNSVGTASVEFYRAALDAAGIDADALSFAETVEVTRRLYAISADFRRTRADAAKAEREEAARIAKAKRDADRAKRAEEEIAKIEAKLAKLRGGE